VDATGASAPVALTTDGPGQSKTSKTAPQGAVSFGDWRRAGKMGELPGAHTQ